MMDCSYTDYLKELYAKMSRQGIFLTVKSRDGRVNTMTLGWASIGWQWIKPTATVLVRQSRYTYELLKDAESFTLSVPKDAALDHALSFCGTKSGRDWDKFGENGLTLLPGKTVDTPVIGQAWLHYECRLLGSTLMTREEYDPALAQRIYGDGDMHELFFGEITAVYTI